MNRKFIPWIAALIFLTMAACSVSLLGTPPPFPTSIFSPSATPTPVPSLPSPTPAGPTSPAPTLTLPPGPAPTGVPTQAPSGPYAVIRVAPADVLNLRSSPDPASPVVGSFPPAATNVMRTGPSAAVGDGLWVQVQNPGGGAGWVNAKYLTEYVSQSTFCADGRVNTLLANLGGALAASDGAQLASLVSPAHGVDVRLYRYGTLVNYDAAHAQALFESTYPVDWGPAPGSGQETAGPFHEAVLPGLLDVFNAPPPGYSLTCDAVKTGGASYDTSWPALYANVNFYSAYRPGPSGDELNWRTVLVGVEYVGGQPYLFGLTQLTWEP